MVTKTYQTTYLCDINDGSDISDSSDSRYNKKCSPKNFFHVTKLKNSKCDKTQKLKMAILKNPKCKKFPKTQILTKLKMLQN